VLRSSGHQLTRFGGGGTQPVWPDAHGNRLTLRIAHKRRTPAASAPRMYPLILLFVFMGVRRDRRRIAPLLRNISAEAMSIRPKKHLLVKHKIRLLLRATFEFCAHCASVRVASVRRWRSFALLGSVFGRAALDAPRNSSSAWCPGDRYRRALITIARRNPEALLDAQHLAVDLLNLRHERFLALGKFDQFLQGCARDIAKHC